MKNFETLLQTPIDFDTFLNNIGMTPEDLLKSKDKSLSNKIIVKRKIITNFSGSWGVPNTSSITTVHFTDKPNDLEKVKIYLKSEKKKETEHRKKQKSVQDKHDYRYQRPSTEQTTYELTTLKKFLKNYDSRPKSTHSSFGSSTHRYFILKDEMFN